MGFFDKILKAIGFESVEEENTKKPKKESVTSSKFNLKNKSYTLILMQILSIKDRE